MIPLSRLPEPSVLSEHKDEWKRRYLDRRRDNPAARPWSAQYGHPRIRAALEAMSHGKCFYCEGKPPRLTVDHGIEVKEAPELAFVWSNLYLACEDCQNKVENRLIPVSDCVDPCAQFEPERHFAFDDESIRPISPCGDKTVRKYHLNGEIYEGRRARMLVQFLKALRVIEARLQATARTQMSAQEVAILRRFAAPDHPYSLMFRMYLERHGLDNSA